MKSISRGCSEIIFPAEARAVAPKHNASLFVIVGCLNANELFVRSSSRQELFQAQHSLWLGIPFGFARHGEVLVEREGDERAGRLSCDSGQLLNWTTNKQTKNGEKHNTATELC